MTKFIAVCGCGFRETNDGINSIVMVLQKAKEHSENKNHTVSMHGEFTKEVRTVPAPMRRPMPKDPVPA